MICIKNGTIHDGLGNILKADIIIESGKIKQIGTDLDASGMEVLDASGKLVFPGFMDGASEWGIMQRGQELKGDSKDNDERSEVFTPEQSVVYAFNGRAVSEQEVYKQGITSCGVFPSNSNLFGGKIAVFKTLGMNPLKLLVKADVGMKASVSKSVKAAYGARNIAPMTKMGIFSMLEAKLKEAEQYNPEDEKSERNEKLLALKRVLSGELPLFVSATDATEVESVLRVTRPYEKIQLIFVNGYGIRADMKELLDRGCGVILAGLHNGFNKAIQDTNLKDLFELYSKGMPLAFTAFGDNSFAGKEDLLWPAVRMYKENHHEEEILKMLTSVPAKMLGVSHRVGSIQEGLDADLVIWNDNPLTTYRAHTEITMMNGKIVYEREGE